MSSAKRKSWCTRRRTRSVGSMPFAWQAQHLRLQTQSDEMCSSSTSKDKDYSNFFQSDSDDVCSSTHQNTACFFNVSNISGNGANNIESDSFNENSPCRRSARRKRKFKRIAIDTESFNSNRLYSNYMSHKYNKKLRVMRHSLNCQNNKIWLSSGKRKRSMREKVSVSVDGGDSSDLGREAKVLALSKLSLNDYPDEQYGTMEVSYNMGGVSSSSISSSGSEAGIFTNDEGREGDDEQSDWVGDIGIAAGSSFDHENADSETDNKMYTIYQKFLLGNFEQLSSEEKKLCKVFSDKDVRASRRRGRSFKPNFNVVLPSDEKDSKFFPDMLQDTYSKKNEMETESGMTTRRHTFSGYKKKKRIPQPSQLLMDKSLDKSSPLTLPTIHKLSDISSSDSKDSLQ
ncbi:G patch domain-containing protein 2-like [Planococcus citri]|uniref:G patch domain-containing protein 2-like n=1 Tax=Planococcus citri TaxID=170843 RepID=UPI0031F89C3A